jgi:Na+-transporting NADH:ubiquinone oxidoreductase subunit A
MKIVVKKGLDIPIAGKPEGVLQHLEHPPRQIALNLDPFDDIRFKVHAKVGLRIKIGEPLVESKAVAGQMFVSCASGVITEIRRGLKRRLLDIIIDVDREEHFEEHGKLDLQSVSRKEILRFFMRTGLFPHIRLRPFNLIPDPKFIPRDIFVTALETRPFAPPYEMQVQGYENYFQTGLNTLTKLTTGKVHLVYGQESSSLIFKNAENVEKHTATGAHPAGMSSLHIHKIAPIRHAEDYVWALSALDTLVIGKMVLEGRYFTDRIIAIAGNGILEDKRGFFYARQGYPIKDLIEGRLSNQFSRLISGDPLTGIKVEQSDFLSFSHNCFSAIPENTEREAFHFLRLGLNKFSATRAYFTGHVKAPQEGYPFTTNQHGEERAFVDGDIYSRVMPMRIPTMFLIKAILAQDFEQGVRLGLLEVAPEDFALPAFICPSKIDMISIVKDGLCRFAKEMIH